MKAFRGQYLQIDSVTKDEGLIIHMFIIYPFFFKKIIHIFFHLFFYNEPIISFNFL
ncbi:unnamed protein product [Schistosoma rodhaini]|uniref:Uncharacterized protein n=1 Tax=Schistosoma rodhaini TaxID=6188 RepID=A0AA85FCW3_9TREM|nr:unnamed protein product [Schistosoma rodhaini]